MGGQGVGCCGNNGAGVPYIQMLANARLMVRKYVEYHSAGSLLGLDVMIVTSPGTSPGLYSKENSNAK